MNIHVLSIGLGSVERLPCVAHGHLDARIMYSIVRCSSCAQMSERDENASGGDEHALLPPSQP